MKKLTTFIGIVSIISSCTPFKKADSSKTILLDTVTAVLPAPERPKYNESNKREHDLLHTKLEVKFDYNKAWVHGNATLTLTPYFYPSNTLELDAKGFDIKKVALEDLSKNHKDLVYKYDGEKLSIRLDREYARKDTFSIYIQYTAKPDERKAGGSSAINSDKGLFFINPDGKDADKPIQIWTQGETESNSAWFPTIDSPNERMSQELFITVDNKYSTLSNGILIFSLDNGDGMRTDIWKQDLPHAPYLTMMAIGEYAIVKDKWKDIDVHYYVEKKYEPSAYKIFGLTPEMLEFYSSVLGVKYPWDKYHQVVVRDYVSGAMENTSAVIYGEFMYGTPRELIDISYEHFVAHELFHHWFGDLVTCESWANLPLNESLANYGEYLWFDHKYGRDAADHHLQGALSQYLMESKNKQVDMIRFDYEHREDMFDSHSYAKGGRILHMLRKYVGDEAFFESLKLYLNENKYTSVEIHHLRLAFEKVTGEDLNWFFDQWFLSSGHPELAIATSYDDSLKKVTVSVRQNQNFAKTPVYKLPLTIDIYANGTKERHPIVIDKVFEEFSFASAKKPDLINFDAEKALLGVKKEQKSAEEWAFQYINAPLFLDRYEALENLSKITADTLVGTIFTKALDDKYWSLRSMALKNTSKAMLIDEKGIKQKLFKLAAKDEKSNVRAVAVQQLVKNYKKDEDVFPLIKESLKDSSYLVVSEALNAMVLVNEKEALETAAMLENEKNAGILHITIANIYAEKGNSSHNAFFLKTAHQVSGNQNPYNFLITYGAFLKDKPDDVINSGIPMIEDIAVNSSKWWMRLGGVQVLGNLYSMYKEKELALAEKLKKTSLDSDERVQLNQTMKNVTEQKEALHGLLLKIKEKETDKNLTKFLEAF